MRMWLLPTEIMCKTHVLGEHYELHKLIGSINKRKNITGFLTGLVNPDLIVERHEYLIQSLKGHKSPIHFTSDGLAYLRTLTYEPIDFMYNTIDLACRCEKCRGKIEFQYGVEFLEMLFDTYKNKLADWVYVKGVGIYGKIA